MTKLDFSYNWYIRIALFMSLRSRRESVFKFPKGILGLQRNTKQCCRQKNVFNFDSRVGKKCPPSLQKELKTW